MKTILYKPIFVNPQAYSILPCVQYPEKGEETNIEANYTGTLTITDSTGLIRSYQNQKVIDLGEYQGIITIDNITLDGAVRLGQWDISGIDTFVKPIASYRCYDKTNDDTDRAILKDLTGNGHDIQLYNFAFAESSGYGKYATDFTKWSKGLGGSSNINKNKLTITSTTGNISDSIIYLEKFDFNLTVKVYGLDSGNIYFSKRGSNLTDGVTVSKDGIYTIEPHSTGYSIKSDIDRNSCNIAIEQIPDYQGALVSDGVDDYGLCENFPIFTKEKGYTVCAIRKNFQDILGIDQCFISNRQNGLSGAFDIELGQTVNLNSFRVDNFGVNNRIKKEYYPYLFTFQTSKTYNGINISIGNRLGTNIINLFRLNYDTHDYYNFKGALYALEIYDRDLTDEEVATVKARMIAEYEEKTGEKYPIEYPGLIAAWSAEGKTNSDPDRNILKDLTGNGHDITLNNFAFNSEGSGYEHPDYPDALVFDGVDDYGINEDMPILTDYTVIFKREHLSITDSYPVAKLDVTKGSFGLDNSYNYGVNSFKTFTAEAYKEYMGNILWMTPNSLCGVKITKGTKDDTNILVLGNYGTYSNFAFYSLYLFDHSLGEQEIKSFIRKYIDPDYVLPSEQTTE